MTLEKLVNIFQVFVSGGTIDSTYFYPHGILKDFGYGDYFKIDTVQSRKYPYLWVISNPSYVKGTSLQLTFTFVFADILDSNESNLLQVQSDMLQCATDMIAFYSTNFGYGMPGSTLFDIRLDESSVYLEPFLHLRDNETAGYIMRATFIMPQSLNFCNQPNYNNA